MDDRLKIAAVASGTGGLHLVDVSDPMLPQLIQTIDGDVNQVEVHEGLAFATVGSSLRAYDLLSGFRQQTAFPGIARIVGLARDGLMLYTMDESVTLSAVDISGFQMQVRGNIQLAHGGGKLFVGNGIAYASAINSYFRGGFSTIDVSDPDDFRLISGSDFNVPFTAPGTDVVANGSGLGIVVGTPADSVIHAVDVFNLADPSVTNAFLTRFEVDDSPQDATIAAGQAFVAAATAGLQVVNYVSFDSQGVAPTVVAQVPDSADMDPATEGIQVPEGASLPDDAHRPERRHRCAKRTFRSRTSSRSTPDSVPFQQQLSHHN